MPRKIKENEGYIVKKKGNELVSVKGELREITDEEILKRAEDQETGNESNEEEEIEEDVFEDMRGLYVWE